MRLSTGRRWSAVSAAACLALAAVTATSTTAAAETPPAPAGKSKATGAKTVATVTLITGDVVTVTQDGERIGTTKVKRPEGATGGYSMQTAHGETYLFPDEAYPYVTAGVLDKRLFNLTDLIADGFAGAGELPLIVTYTDAAVRARSAAAPADTELVRALPSIQGAAVTADTDDTAALWRSLAAGKGARSPRTAAGRAPAFGAGIAKVWLDGKVKARMAESNAQIGSPAAWAAGVDGSGVTVAVLDSGYDDTHPGFDGRIADSRSFVPGETVQDRNGHGTHTASTVAGTGAGSTGNQEKGVAPGAELAIGKVLGDDGNGDESWIIAGMEWAATEVKAPVVSMSLGTREPGDGLDPMSEAVNTLSEETGSLFVIAAGNSYNPGTIGSPGAAAEALTVGAVDGADQLADFSSEGPLHGTNALKPDISAPGVEILAARSSYLSSGEGAYQTMSGTSMATPHVAGVAAMLKQQHPAWAGRQLKNALMSSAEQLPDASAYSFGAGRLDAAAATSAKLVATGSVDFGFFAWPATDDKPVSREITYTNPGDKDVVLSLSSDFGAWNPAVTLSADTVTVPAHGTAGVTATADPAEIDSGAAGVNASGRIRAADATGTVLAHTAGALTKEAERYALDITVLDRAGRPAPGASVIVQRFDSPYPDGYTTDENGQVRLRHAPTTVSVSASLDVAGATADSRGRALLMAPETALAKDTTLVLDARKAVRTDALTERKSEQVLRYLEYRRQGGAADLLAKYFIPVALDSMWVTPTERVTSGEFGFVTRIRAAEPLLTLSVAGRTLDDAAVQIGSPVRDGRFVGDRPLVFAGEGAAAD
ncbi:MAG: S8 family serine peptidase, partial [Actinomadura sp.]